MESGETELRGLLAALVPGLLPGEYVFCSLPEARRGEADNLPVLATFREEEGLSLVLERSLARRRGFADSAAMRCISLGVHSSLKAVGLTAAISGALARRGISANVIAAYYHDHLFVPAERAQEALRILLELSEEQGA